MPKCRASKNRSTLKRDPIDENLEVFFEDLVVSSGTGGNKFATNEHLEAASNS